MRHRTMLAAVVAAGVGGGALGDHHGGGGGPIAGLVNCSSYPWWCWGECAELNACRSGNTPIGDSNCTAAEANLSSCSISSPPYVPPVIIVPPPACPTGQHLNDEGVCEEESGCPEGQHTGDDGECQADHECGNDEIGGGSVECEACGEGETPNVDGTACLTCEHGESTDGVCDPPCWRAATDAAAEAALDEYPAKKPFERGVAIYCVNNEVQRYSWARSTDNACSVEYSNPYSSSCWPGEGGNKETGCNLARVHTHPWFTKADKDAMCHGSPVGDDPERHFTLNRAGMRFSWKDGSTARQFGVEAHLGVSNRTCVKAYRRSGRKEVVSGKCKTVERPEEESTQ